MAWLSLTATEVKTRLTGAELAALQTAALAPGQSDPLPEVTSQVVNEVRGYVAAGGFTLGAGETIPDKLESASLAMIRYRLASRLPGKGFSSEARTKEYEGAITLLRDVAARRFLVEEPATAATEEIGAPSPSFTRRALHFNRANQDGL